MDDDREAAPAQGVAGKLGEAMADPTRERR